LMGASPPPRQIAHHLPKRTCDNTGWVHGMPPCCARYAPHIFLDLILFGYISNKSQKNLDDLMGKPPGFSTHVCEV
jgi:hypothetical protein